MPESLSVMPDPGTEKKFGSGTGMRARGNMRWAVLQRLGRFESCESLATPLGRTGCGRDHL